MKKVYVDELAKADNRVRCYSCGAELKKGATGKNVYNSTSQSHSHYKHFPYCMNCIITRFEKFLEAYKGNAKVALFHLCQWIDMPYITKFASKEYHASGDFVRKYFRSIQNSTGTSVATKASGFLGSDTIYEIDVLKDASGITDSETQHGNATNFEQYIKYGRNPKYTKENYDDMEAYYDKMIALFGGDASEDKKIAIINAAKAYLVLQEAYMNGNPDTIEKANKVYETALKSGELSQEAMNKRNVGAVLVQDIVQLCEADGFVEPWDQIIKYPHQMDIVDQIILNLANFFLKNHGKEELKELPDELKVVDHLGELSPVETEMDRQAKIALKEIAAFKGAYIDGGVDDDEAAEGIDFDPIEEED